MPMLRLCGGTLSSRRPSRVIVPCVGVSKPANIIRHVVLPDPDGPSSVRKSPCGMSRSRCLMISVLPSYVLRTPAKRTRGSTCLPGALPKGLSGHACSDESVPSEERIACDGPMAAGTVRWLQRARSVKATGTSWSDTDRWSYRSADLLVGGVGRRGSDDGRLGIRISDPCHAAYTLTCIITFWKSVPGS